MTQSDRRLWLPECGSADCPPPGRHRGKHRFLVPGLFSSLLPQAPFAGESLAQIGIWQGGPALGVEYEEQANLTYPGNLSSPDQPKE